MCYPVCGLENVQNRRLVITVFVLERYLLLAVDADARLLQRVLLQRRRLLAARHNRRVVDRAYHLYCQLRRRPHHVCCTNGTNQATSYENFKNSLKRKHQKETITICF